MTVKRGRCRFVLDDGPMVKILRCKEDLTVGQLAVIIGASTAAIRRWERGGFGDQRGIPASVAAALLRALRLAPDSHAIGHYTGPPPSRVDGPHRVAGWALPPMSDQQRADACRHLESVMDLLHGKGK